MMRAAAGPLIASVLASALPQAGCAFAVDHPAVAAGAAGTVIGFGSCELSGVDNGRCAAIGAAAGAFLALVAAAALWLGGDGQSVPVEEQARPLPDDGRPAKQRKKHVPPAAEPGVATPAAPDATQPAGPTSAPAVPPSAPPASPPAAAPVNPPSP